MTKKELMRIIEKADKYDMELEGEKHYDEIFKPVYDALTSNDESVIQFLCDCTIDEQDKVFTSIRCAVLDKKANKKVEELYINLCKECGCPTYINN